jgi:DNA-binding winged helix-turn-helix (wHTH) protein/TolB-like protein
MSAQSNIDLGFERYCVDRRDERLIGPHGPIKIGNKAYQVLLKLIEQGGRLVTKDSLMSSVWDGTIVSEFSLTSAIKELRRALGDDARAPRFIENVYGRGYRFLTPIDEINGERPATGLSAVNPPSRAPLPVGVNDAPAAAEASGGASPERRVRWPAIGLRSLGAKFAAAAMMATSVLALAPAGLDRIGAAAHNSAPSAQASAATAAGVTLAVLPFEDLDGKESRSLGGIQEQVIDSLARAPGLRVTGRTLASALGSEASLPDARRQAGLTHLLEGSVRTAGARVLVHIRLLRADDGTQIWSDRFELAGTHAETIEREVGQAAAARVRERFRQAAS